MIVDNLKLHSWTHQSSNPNHQTTETDAFRHPWLFGEVYSSFFAPKIRLLKQQIESSTSDQALKLGLKLLL